jgi:hypothetical protein
MDGASLSSVFFATTGVNGETLDPGYRFAIPG